jgi:hypothetical protein
MPIDWDKFGNEIDDIVKKAADAADGDAKVISRASSLSRLSDDELAQIIPTAADAKKLGELMKIVYSATDHNKKINQIVAGGQDMVKVLMKMTEVVGKTLL